jgi:Fe2+ transport system protein FeoA
MEPASVNGLFDGTLDAQGLRATFIGGTADLREDASISYRDEVQRSATPSGVRLPLAMTAVGDRVWVVQIKGGHRMVRRLTDVGIVEGSEITIVSRTEKGSVIVAFQGCRVVPTVASRGQGVDDLRRCLDAFLAAPYQPNARVVCPSVIEESLAKLTPAIATAPTPTPLDRWTALKLLE